MEPARWSIEPDDLVDLLKTALTEAVNSEIVLVT